MLAKKEIFSKAAGTFAQCGQVFGPKGWWVVWWGIVGPMKSETCFQFPFFGGL